MTYSGSTGDVNAFGNVVVTQGNRTLLANRITGNTKTTEYRTADGPYRYLEDGGKTKDLTGDVMTYRTSDQHFDAGHTQGWSDPCLLYTSTRLLVPIHHRVMIVWLK